MEIIRVIAAITSAIVSLVRLVYDIIKDRKQKSNRPTKV